MAIRWLALVLTSWVIGWVVGVGWPSANAADCERFREDEGIEPEWMFISLRGSGDTGVLDPLLLGWWFSGYAEDAGSGGVVLHECRPHHDIVLQRVGPVSELP